MRHIRRSKGLTQKELAKKIGISQSYISKLESNEEMLCNLSLKNVNELARFMEICPVILATSLIKQCYKKDCFKRCGDCG
ncbi:MAG: Helix-turn-helix domain [Anaerocolumna sp.]|nr:Helix-turn-helix domain [Anaerocolumna sp.]